MTKYYPIMLNIEEKKCTVVGGGRVAERKVKSLLEHGAVVTVMSPTLTDALQEMVRQGQLLHHQKHYETGDLRGSYLVYVATDDLQVSQACHEEASRENILMNVVDVPRLCDFTVPAIVRRGPLTVAIASDGKSPMLSRKIREELEKRFGQHYEDVLELLGEMRVQALNEINEIEDRKQLFQQLIYEHDVENLGKKGKEILWREAWQFYEAFKKQLKGCDKNENNKNRIKSQSAGPSSSRNHY
ncbi:siroheme synthase [Alkaliphilus metalliredigens QYMF]|uniref:precorrin-2 dehydrogenase n=1 Tax=Alkaliphilus metalliredigens (strain QYMF) TaxID=293826 RepID=A6TJD4_ALKMQ|nr:bifunctional precorrin-2 dehydrogenase/sirohydrochlorin ferrochelatase [Alkaliphilus metalliredigens]ABR46302.1 siroheme synthase [Alkaliphilus metalliredigens QYMF]